VTGSGWLPLAILATSLLPAVIVFFLPEEARRARILLNLGGAGIKLILMGLLLWDVWNLNVVSWRTPLLPGLDLVLAADAKSLLFATLSSLLWFLTTIYAVGYLEGSPRRSRFFGFFNLCVSATLGIALAGNLVTFLVFYEILTLSTWPLVVHRGTPEAMRAGRVYLAYTLTGGAVLLAGIVWLGTLAGFQDFVPGGYLADLATEHGFAVRTIFFLLLAGFGVKAAIVPLHGWLPRAMVAPAPVSALLHAVAVVKAGAFGLIRTTSDVFGPSLLVKLGLNHVFLWLVVVTIIYGSVRALHARELKQRLAFSTVSQVSYVALGLALAGPVAAVGGLVHLVHQGLMKITLFFCAGNFAETLGIHRVDEIRGVGRRMPWTMGAFTVAAFGMIGVPPMAGFISKWYLARGAMEVGHPWVVAVLVVSTLLNAAYFLPVIFAGWFAQPSGPWPRNNQPGGRLEAHWMLLFPTVFVALIAIAAGLLAGLPVSPLAWAELIVRREFLP